MRTANATRTRRNQRKVRALEKAGRRRQTIFHQEIQRSIRKDLIFLQVSIHKLMHTKKIKSLEKRIERIVKKLAAIQPMRPGSISKQYRDRQNKRGAYYQLSYTHKMKSRTEHVWPDHVKALQKEIEEYRKFKKLTSELVDLSIELSKEKIAQLRSQGDGPG